MYGSARRAAVGEANAATWIAEPKVVAVDGFLAVPDEEIRAGNGGRHNCHLPAHAEGPERHVKSCQTWAKT